MGTALKSAGVLVQASLLGLVLAAAPVSAESRIGDEDGNIGRSSGNWSRSTDGGEDAKPKKKKKAAKRGGKNADVPVPRPKPGSKAAKREAAARKKAAAEAKKNDSDDKKVVLGNTEDTTKDENGRSVPLPKAKPKKPAPEKKVQAGLVSDEGSSNAPYRGSMSKGAIKEVLVGRTVSSRIDGKEARIKLGTAGKLSWSISGASGAGFWWTEKGRVCDRYDAAGDFPGRGAGCRSFEQRADGYYAGGKKVNFLH